MLDSYIIIGLVIALVAILKTFKAFKTVQGKLTIPLIVFGIAGIVNVANVLVFGGTTILEALKTGFDMGAAAGGIYSMGQTYLNKTDSKQSSV